MTKEELIDKLYEVQNTLGKGKIESALNSLLKICRETTQLKEIINSIIIFQSTNSHLFNDEILIGNVNNIEKTKLVRGILEIIDKAIGIVNETVHIDYNSILKRYLKTVVYDFQRWQNRFVHIEGNEKIEEVQVYVHEIIDQDDESTEDDSIHIRQGIISKLRNEIEEKQIIMIGDAGMGKSTTLQFIAYNDANLLLQSENIFENKNFLIPIYIELKLFTETDNLIQKISTKLGIAKDKALELIDLNKLNLLIDGLNEVEKSIKAKVFTQINNMIYDFPNLKMIISSRPQYYQRDFDNAKMKIPVFQLKKMNEIQINEFLNKNGKHVQDIIRKEIEVNKNLQKIVNNPLLLHMLINVVTREGSIPTNKAKIIQTFIKSLYTRERQEKDLMFDPDTVHILLTYLGFQSRKDTGSNVGLNKDTFILPLLEKRKNDLGLEINLLYVLNKAVELQILVRDAEQYSFTHEIYQEFFAAEYLKSTIN